MTVVTRQAMSDDDGTFTFGTAINKAFVDQVYDQIDDQAHSTVNPTVKPKTITDEVITARNGQASLNAYLATLVSTGYLTGASDLGQDWKVIGGRALTFVDADVAHGMTTVEATDVWGSLRPISATAGGVLFTGLADTDQRGLQVYGINGSAAPTLGGLTLTGAKKSGTAAAAMAAAEIVMFISNYTTNMAKFYGDGSLCLLTGGLSVGFDGQPGVDEIQVGDANFKLDWQTTDMNLQFDTNDYLQYDRTNNQLDLVIGSTLIFRVEAAGITISSAGIQLGATTVANNSITFVERADPSAPDLNEGVLYLKDNGAGKTQLVIRFNTGAVQVIATQP